MKNNKSLIAIAIQSALAIPSFAFAGDVEIHLPAATDAMTVDQPAGTELMRVNGDGNVGIGTSIFNSGIFGSGTHLGQQILHHDGSAVLSLESYRDSGNHSKVWATANRGTQASPLPLNADDFILELNASAYDGTNFDNAARIALGVDTNGTVTPGTSMPGKIVFRTSPDGSVGDVERVRIDSVGRVGIGSATPTATLFSYDTDTSDAGYPAVSGSQASGDGRVASFATGATTIDLGVNVDGTGWLQTRELNDYSLNKNFILNANGGDVGIGTISPAGKLDVKDANGRLGLFSGATFAIRDTNNVLVVRNTSEDPGNFSQIVMERGDGSGDDMSLSTKYDGANGVEALSIASQGSMLMSVLKGGNVGIGTSTPSDGTANGGQVLKLDVEGAIGATHFCDENGENCQTAASLGGGDDLGNHTATQDIDLAASKLVGNGGSSGIAIDATGNVGMGTATPASSLDIFGSSASIVTLRDGDSTVNDPGHAAAIHLLDGQGATTGFMGFGTGAEGMSIQNANDDGGIHFSTGGNTNQMTVAANGKVGIGTQTPTATLFSVDIDTSDAGYPAVSGDHVATADGRVASFATGARTIDLGINAADGTAWLQPRNLAGYSQNNNLILNPNGGNIGVGTTAPSTALDVNGVITSSGGSASMTINNTGPLPNGMTQNFQSNGVDMARITGYTGDEVAGSLHFGVSNAGSMQDSLSIASTGNVGIGTTAPGALLHLQSNSDGMQVEATGASAGWGGYLDFHAPNSPAGADNRRFSIINYNNAAGNYLEFRASNDDHTIKHADMLTLNTNGNVGIGTASPAFKLDSFGSARIALPASGSYTDFRINKSDGSVGFIHDNTGNTGIGTNVPDEKLHVVGGVKFAGLSAGSTGNYVCRDTSGVITHGGSCSASDKRLKKDIKPVKQALAKVTQLQGVTYKWKDEAQGKRTELGLIAQDVEKVVPEVVDTANDDMGTRSIRYEDLVALLIESTKEQQAQIAAQQQRIEALEAKLQ